MHLEFLAALSFSSEKMFPKEQNRHAIQFLEHCMAFYALYCKGFIGH
jgi:hypothetical protein